MKHTDSARAKDLREHLQLVKKGATKRGWEAVFALKISEALHAPETELRHVAAELASAFQAWLAESDRELRKVVAGNGNDADPKLLFAYRLGQVAAAQSLAAQAIRSRTDISLSNSVTKFLKYLRPLMNTELTNTQLANQINESVAHVTRRLSEMRQLGLTDFRKESKSTINFVTKAAGALIPMEAKFDIPSILRAESSFHQTKAFQRVVENTSPQIKGSTIGRVRSSGHYQPPAPARKTPQHTLARMTRELRPHLGINPTFGRKTPGEMHA